MGKDNAELYSIIPFKEKDRWYLKLIYKYMVGLEAFLYGGTENAVD